MGGGAQSHRIFHHVLGNGYLVCRAPHGKQLVAVASGRRNFRHGLLGHVDYGYQLFKAGVWNYELEHKAVHLRLGKRIGTVLLNGVLRCKHKEGLGHLSGNAHYRNGVLLHRLEQRRLRFGRCAVDLVCEDYVAEYGTGLETESGVARVVLDYYVGTRNVSGHQVGRELYAREGEGKHSSERPHKPRLAYAGNAFQKHVAACYHCNNGAFNNFVLTYDVASYLCENVFALFAELLYVLLCYHI